MALDRYRRIARLWNWLPAFRAVAEYESVQAAGAALALSPSALSRAVRLIEDELGEPLFVRSPGGLTLTTRGRALLLSTRDAMRGVDDALGPAREEQAVRLKGADSILSAVLARAAGPVFAAGRTLSLGVVPAPDIAAQLLRGDADLVLTYAAAVDEPALRVDALPGLRFVVAGGAAADPGILVGVEGSPRPPRPTAATATTLDAAIALAEQLGACAVVPACCMREGWRLNVELDAVLPVFAVQRKPVGDGPPVYLTALLESAAQVLSA